VVLHGLVLKLEAHTGCFKDTILIVNFSINMLKDRACGFDAGVEDYPLIYFVSPYQAYLYRSVCVKACPNASEGK
jgi:hypothetical protein